MKLNINTFGSYELTSEEVYEGVTFTLTQRAVIQNLLAEAAVAKVNLKVDATNISKFLQQEAELQGKINVLRYLLDVKEDIDTNKVGVEGAK